MAQIRIKRSTGSTAPNSSDLANAELAFTEGSDILYYGEGTSGSNAASVIKIGGSGAFMALTGAQTVGGNKTFSNDVIISGDLTVSGSTTTLNTTNSTVKDTLMELGTGTSGTPSNDSGIVIDRGSENNVFIGWDESADKFTMGTGTFTGASTGDLSISAGTLVVNIEGNVTGNVTGNTSGSSGSCTGNAATATTLATARTIGGTSFDGSANIAVNLAATATALATARNIGGVSFDGTANINLPGVNASGTQNTSGTAAGLSGTPDVTVGVVTAGSLDISGDADIDGTLEADAITVGGTALNTVIAGVTVSNATTAATGTQVTVSANNSTDETVYPVFVDGATGAQGIESDTGFTYNPSSGLLTIGGELDAASLDISGDADIDGTLEADAITVNGTTLAEYISDTVGAMVGSNTESGITVTYQDGDNTIDFAVGTLNQDTTGTAAIATTVTVADESSDTTCFPLFVDSATGNLAPKSDSQLTYNSSTGELGCTIIDGGTW